ncbi:response regulator [Pseudohoeflea coraliihabitans]|uniref:Response regulatory domain-containing protein n=1 Tax=Pseudohoeflea coraliihabitans TaxID=2860393 RepID=A0ABS6WMS2_9HYPH|nr:hypothetical protein [Pseudohoeflea sp. DP4N28-3]MBW3096405.1 hypothetical protein [Pseudohoeflea sp. DP4N28-3]
MTQKQTVLLVEDDPIIALDALESIEEQGFKCLVAHDPRTALAVLAASWIDCALLDFDLGGETSVPVADVLSQCGRPFAVVSGRDHAELINRIPTAARIYGKPVDYGKLARELVNQTAAGAMARSLA